MYICINCGTETAELYRRYCPSVLKVLKCENCRQIADKYIEYDPVIVFLDLILIEKKAYRHLLYNSEFKFYWKLMIILWLSDTLQVWSSCGSHNKELLDNTEVLQSSCNFYVSLSCTALSLIAFIGATIVTTELFWLFFGGRPPKYQIGDLCRALIIGGCTKLLGLLGIVWKHISFHPHLFLIQAYSTLCLLTAYSVVCKSGKGASLIGLTSGFLAYSYIFNITSTLPLLMAFNITLE